MYSILPNLVLGFHGCDEETLKKVLYEHEKLKDCAVIQRIHQYNKEKQKRSFDSVRGIFLEGNPVYENSGIKEKTHVQLCVVNPNCIKGYFKPSIPNKEWAVV